MNVERVFGFVETVLVRALFHLSAALLLVRSLTAAACSQLDSISSISFAGVFWHANCHARFFWLRAPVWVAEANKSCTLTLRVFECWLVAY
mmetsp:Transcript_53037/g.84363  ORF Transcript_53037/g.84363 Transcript_53037/m.84363 type:complete len:91 (-) Transcript_53037:79-351(-)